MWGKKPNAEVKRWRWYKTWAMMFLRPSIETGQKIISDGNISVQQAVVWQVISAFINSFLLAVTLSYFNVQGYSLWSVLISVVIDLVGFLVLTGFVHLLARLLRRKGSFTNLYILFAAINSSLLLFIGIVCCLTIFIRDQAFISVYFFAIIYGALRLYPLPARVVYRVNWLIAFLISVVVPGLVIFSCTLTYLYFSYPWK